MYENPINVYIEQSVKRITEQRDNEICQYITEKFNVDVNREELIKALNYDRGQYSKGHTDAKKELTKMIYSMALDEAGVLSPYISTEELLERIKNL